MLPAGIAMGALYHKL